MTRIGVSTCPHGPTKYPRHKSAVAMGSFLGVPRGGQHRPAGSSRGDCPRRGRPDPCGKPRQHWRFVNKACIVDLLHKKIRHVGTRDEPGAPVARIDQHAIRPRARPGGQDGRANDCPSRIRHRRIADADVPSGLPSRPPNPAHPHDGVEHVAPYFQPCSKRFSGWQKDVPQGGVIFICPWRPCWPTIRPRPGMRRAWEKEAKGRMLRCLD